MLLSFSWGDITLRGALLPAHFPVTFLFSLIGLSYYFEVFFLPRWLVPRAYLHNSPCSEISSDLHRWPHFPVNHSYLIAWKTAGGCSLISCSTRLRSREAVFWVMSPFQGFVCSACWKSTLTWHFFLYYLPPPFPWHPFFLWDMIGHQRMRKKGAVSLKIGFYFCKLCFLFCWDLQNHMYVFCSVDFNPMHRGWSLCISIGSSNYRNVWNQPRKWACQALFAHLLPLGEIL